jgi:hypothetical protein
MPGSVECDQGNYAFNTNDVYYRLIYDKNGELAYNPNEGINNTHLPVNGACVCDPTSTDFYCGYYYNNDGPIHGCQAVAPENSILFACEFKKPADSGNLYCWVQSCEDRVTFPNGQNNSSQFYVTCDDQGQKQSESPPKVEPFKSPYVYSLLVADGAVTGYKDSDLYFYDKTGQYCFYSSPRSNEPTYKYYMRNADFGRSEADGQFGLGDADLDGMSFIGSIMARDVVIGNYYSGFYFYYDNRR